LKDRSCGFGAYKHPGCRQRNCIVGGAVSKSVREKRLRVNRSESVDASLSLSVVWRSCRVGGRAGRLISDCGGGDRLESLIFAIVLMILMNLTVILMTLMNLTMILMIILTVRQEKWVENSATGALAVTRDIRIVMIFPRIQISRIVSADIIRIVVSVVNTGCCKSRAKGTLFT
jgi:hypothetical protein